MNELYRFALSKHIKESDVHSLSTVKGGFSMPRLYVAKKSIHKVDDYTIYNEKTGYVILRDTNFSSYEKAQTLADLLTVGTFIPESNNSLYNQRANLKRLASKLLYKELIKFNYSELLTLAYEMLTYDSNLKEPIYSKSISNEIFNDIEENHKSYKKESNKSKFLINVLSNYPKIDLFLEL